MQVLTDGVIELSPQQQLLPVTKCDPETFAAVYYSNLAYLAVAGEASIDTTLDEATLMFADKQTDMEEGWVQSYAMVFDGQIVGESGVTLLSEPLVHYWVDKAYQGRHITSGSVRAMTDHIFETNDLDRMTLRIRPTNYRSQRVARSVGAVLEHRGTLAEDWPYSQVFDIWGLHRGR